MNFPQLVKFLIIKTACELEPTNERQSNCGISTVSTHQLLYHVKPRQCRKPYHIQGKYLLTFLPQQPLPQWVITYQVSLGGWLFKVHLMRAFCIAKRLCVILKSSLSCPQNSQEKCALLAGTYTVSVVKIIKKVNLLLMCISKTEFQPQKSSVFYIRLLIITKF